MHKNTKKVNVKSKKMNYNRKTRKSKKSKKINKRMIGGKDFWDLLTEKVIDLVTPDLKASEQKQSAELSKKKENLEELKKVALDKTKSIPERVAASEEIKKDKDLYEDSANGYHHPILYFEGDQKKTSVYTKYWGDGLIPKPNPKI
jgi:hypothetical protein